MSKLIWRNYYLNCLRSAELLGGHLLRLQTHHQTTTAGICPLEVKIRYMWGQSLHCHQVACQGRLTFPPNIIIPSIISLDVIHLIQVKYSHLQLRLLLSPSCAWQHIQQTTPWTYNAPNGEKNTAGQYIIWITNDVVYKSALTFIRSYACSSDRSN